MLEVRTLVCFLAIGIAFQVTCDVIGEKAEAGYYEIDNTTYYWDPTLRSPAGARVHCATVNMTALIFYTPEKYEAVNAWLARDYENRAGLYMTDGIKYMGEQDWFWESTSEPITEFFWQGSFFPIYSNPYWQDLVIGLNANPDGFGYQDKIKDPANPDIFFKSMCQ